MVKDTIQLFYRRDDTKKIGETMMYGPGVAAINRLPKFVDRFFERALRKKGSFAEETQLFGEPAIILLLPAPLAFYIRI